MFRMLVFAVLGLALVATTDAVAQKQKKGRGAQGKIKKVDAATGTITVTVTNRKEKTEMDREFKITDSTKVVVVKGEDRKELTGNDRLKNDEFKEGATVRITLGEDDKVTEVAVGTFPVKKKKQDK